MLVFLRLFFAAESVLPLLSGYARHDELTLVSGELRHSRLDDGATLPRGKLVLGDGEGEGAGDTREHAGSCDFHVCSIPEGWEKASTFSGFFSELSSEGESGRRNRHNLGRNPQPLAE